MCRANFATGNLPNRTGHGRRSGPFFLDRPVRSLKHENRDCAIAVADLRNPETQPFPSGLRYIKSRRELRVQKYLTHQGGPQCASLLTFTPPTTAPAGTEIARHLACRGPGWPILTGTSPPGPGSNEVAFIDADGPMTSPNEDLGRSGSPRRSPDGRVAVTAITPSILTRAEEVLAHRLRSRAGCGWRNARRGPRDLHVLGGSLGAPWVNVIRARRGARRLLHRVDCSPSRTALARQTAPQSAGLAFPRTATRSSPHPTASTVKDLSKIKPDWRLLEWGEIILTFPLGTRVAIPNLARAAPSPCSFLLAVEVRRDTGLCRERRTVVARDRGSCRQPRVGFFILCRRGTDHQQEEVCRLARN